MAVLRKRIRLISFSRYNRNAYANFKTISLYRRTILTSGNRDITGQSVL